MSRKTITVYEEVLTPKQVEVQFPVYYLYEYVGDDGYISDTYTRLNSDMTALIVKKAGYFGNVTPRVELVNHVSEKELRNVISGHYTPLTAMAFHEVYEGVMREFSSHLDFEKE